MELNSIRTSFNLRKIASSIVQLTMRPPDAMAQAQVQNLLSLLSDHSRLVQVLACDALNRYGLATVPTCIQDGPCVRYGHGTTGAECTEVFEARINVDEYNMFEWVHPGYGSQVLEIASQVDAHSCAPETILDVGSGPGAATIMLAELYPESVITALEPSMVAFQHLCQNTSGMKIKPVNSGLLEYSSDREYDIVASIGAYHHLDTYQFLKYCQTLVRPGQFVLVADEMIRPFSSREQRVKNLIAHHSVYIREVLDAICQYTLPEPERDRLLAMRRLTDTRPADLDALLAEVSLKLIDHPGDDSPWPRVRLAVLELEALVAGIHYDVERKTYPANFLAMALDVGMELVAHTRVHPTDGDGEFDAGTHVFCFQRPKI